VSIRFHCSGDPVTGSEIVITKEYLLQYYHLSYSRQPVQYQKLFAELVNLCNQFSFYIDSFLDIDFQNIRLDSESDVQELQKLLNDIRQFQKTSRAILRDFMFTAQCSELKHQVLYSSEISVETMVGIILVLGTVLFVISRVFFSLLVCW
jgi:hypothetical protein